METEFSRYEPIRYECNPSVPKINFPIDFSEVNKMGIKLSEKQKEIIQKNGFVLSEGSRPSLYDYYPKESTIPLFITTDVCLHTFHRFIDSILITVETEYLYGKFQDLLQDSN